MSIDTPQIVLTNPPKSFTVYIVDGLSHPIYVCETHDELDEFISSRVRNLFKIGYDLELRIFPLLLDIGTASIKAYREIKHLPFVAIKLKSKFNLRWYKYDRYPLLDHVKLPKFAQFRSDLNILKDRLANIKTYEALCDFANSNGIDVLTLTIPTNCFKLRSKFSVSQLKKMIILSWLNPF